MDVKKRVMWLAGSRNEEEVFTSRRADIRKTLKSIKSVRHETNKSDA